MSIPSINNIYKIKKLMSLAFFKSLQTIDCVNESSERIKSELNIVHSYLSIDEWQAKKTFAEVLSEKLNAAK
jgi:hypothetical protein